MTQKVGEGDKNEMFDHIFSSPTSLFAPPKVLSKEKVTQKQHLRFTYTYRLIEAIFFHRREKIRQRNKKNKRIVSFRELFCMLAVGCNLTGFNSLASVLTII